MIQHFTHYITAQWTPELSICRDKNLQAFRHSWCCTPRAQLCPVRRLQGVSCVFTVGVDVDMLYKHSEKVGPVTDM